jgi:uncharacterized repeat protein (TIGR03803 family)
MRCHYAICLLAAIGSSGCSPAALRGFAVAGGPTAAAKTFRTSNGTVTTLYSFQGRPDGAAPQSGVVALYSDAPCVTKIFGNTSAGGTNNAGTIYALCVYGGGSVQESTLWSYTPSVDGSGPVGSLVTHNQVSQIVGLASRGGAHDRGTAVELHHQFDGSYRETAVRSFGGHDGAVPYAASPQERTLYYIATFSGGRYGDGAIVSLAGKRLRAHVLYSFTGRSDGEHPDSSYPWDWGHGRFFGTTAGSKSGGGTVYEFVPGHNPTTLYTFTSKADGVTPTGVTEDTDGSLFGTTVAGGSAGYGSIYKLTPKGSTYTKTALHSFSGQGGDGAYPQGTPIEWSRGLLGTTSKGGSAGCGTIYEIDAGGAYTTLYSFTCGNDGAYPNALTWYTQGNVLYGTTSAGGTANEGVVFEFNPYN